MPASDVARPSFARGITGYASPAQPRAADPASLQSLAGASMGTTWSVRMHNPRMLPLAEVKAAIDDALTRVVSQMSHWEADSVLSRHARAPAGSEHVLPDAFAQVIDSALHWARETAGAFDPTVGPVVAAWGFGPRGKKLQPGRAPHDDDIAQARSQAGWQRLAWQADTRTLSQPGGVALDLSGIAKGFAVDHVAQALQALGIHDALVEIGGELRGIGARPDGAPWRVEVDDGLDAPHPVVPLRELAVASSGDRWHVREAPGRRWSHTIDPRTGEPAGESLRCVTVLRPICMEADALATALLVLGEVEGLRFAEARGIAVRFALADGRVLTSGAWLQATASAASRPQAATP